MQSSRAQKYSGLRYDNILVFSLKCADMQSCLSLIHFPQFQLIVSYLTNPSPLQNHNFNFFDLDPTLIKSRISACLN